jgi:hypothetical protein
MQMRQIKKFISIVTFKINTKLEAKDIDILLVYVKNSNNYLHKYN